jgi:hypothetical protein
MIFGGISVFIGLAFWFAVAALMHRLTLCRSA